MFAEEANRFLRDGLIAYEERHGYRKSQENLDAFDHVTWIQALQKEPIIDGIFPAVVLVVGTNNIQALLANGQTTVILPWSGLSWARGFRRGLYRLGACARE